MHPSETLAIKLALFVDKAASIHCVSAVEMSIPGDAAAFVSFPADAIRTNRMLFPAATVAAGTEIAAERYTNMSIIVCAGQDNVKTVE